MTLTVKRTGKDGFMLILQSLPPKAAEITLITNISQCSLKAGCPGCCTGTITFLNGNQIKVSRRSEINPLLLCKYRKPRRHDVTGKKERGSSEKSSVP